MNEFVKLLGLFFRRDFLYIMAGSIIVSAFALAHNNNEFPDLPQYAWVVLIVISYIAGYLAQELFAVFRLVCVRDVNPLNKIFKFFNKRVAKENWIAIKDLDQGCLHELNHEFWKTKETLDPRVASQIERFLILRQIATTFGPSLIVSVLVYWVLYEVPAFTSDLPGHKDVNAASVIGVGIVSIVAGVFLCCQSYYRTTQVALVLADVFPDKIKTDRKAEKHATADEHLASDE